MLWYPYPLMSLKAQEWRSDHLAMLDQRVLPGQSVWLELRSWQAVDDAIRTMAVRGAPAIGIAAAYGLAMAARDGELLAALEVLSCSRPTAVNLMWSVERIRALVDHSFERILGEAQEIEREDLEANMRMGEIGAQLLPANCTVLTLCNTGSLATSGHGTALGVIRTGFQLGKVRFVFSCETRPRCQGLRLTAYELMFDRIPFASIADSVAASLMGAGKIGAVLVGADRIAANGDTANKIGTYSLAVLAHFHGVPCYVVAPTSTIDASLADGSQIPIEERSGDELTMVDGVRIAPEGCSVYNPAFDVTPGRLISAIVTETGVHRMPYAFLEAIGGRE